jgi:hypothetical protein
MKLQEEQRDEVYKNCKIVQKYLYSNSACGLQLFNIAQKYDLHHDDVYKTFAITVGDIVLGFYRVEDTVPLLQQELGISPQIAARLGVDVLDFLAPLSDPNWQPPAGFLEDEETENNTPENVPAPIIETSNEELLPTHQTIPLTENPHPVVPPTTITPQPVASQTATQPFDHKRPLHTMASDMASLRNETYRPSLDLDNEPVHQSQSQDTLRQSLSDIPSYTVAKPTAPPSNPNPPRWHTE